MWENSILRRKKNAQRVPHSNEQGGEQQLIE